MKKNKRKKVTKQRPKPTVYVCMAIDSTPPLFWLDYAKQREHNKLHVFSVWGTLENAYKDSSLEADHLSTFIEDDGRKGTWIRLTEAQKLAWGYSPMESSVAFSLNEIEQAQKWIEAAS